MDVEKNDAMHPKMIVGTLGTSSFGSSEGLDGQAWKAKTSLRLQYEAQSEVLKRQFGGLSGVQSQLGLSARKICQLLMVDPSAWSRWSKDESTVPPHIWRALQWYFALQSKIPGLNAQYFLGRHEHSALSQEVQSIQAEVMQLKRILWALSGFSVFLLVCLMVSLFRTA